MERKTRQREAILEVFQQADRPLSPQEVFNLTSDHIPELGLATVYRSLRLFTANGQLQPVPVPGEPDRYEMTGKHHHHHFICRACNRVFEMEGCPGSLDQLAPKGFKVEKHEIYLFGKCKECASGKRVRA